MIYKTSKGTNKNIFVTLHGTGGEADQLFTLAKEIDSEATLLGIQGDVKENGMNRYFERYPDGNYNFASLDKETDKLFNKMQSLINELGYSDYNLYIMGYSNGANMITNMLRKYKVNARGVMVFHPAIMRMEMPYLKQDNLAAFISSGTQDSYFSQEAMDSMNISMSNQGIKVTEYMHQYGHQLTQDEVVNAKTWFDSINTTSSVYLDFSSLDARSKKNLINGSVVPRPIAWVSTLNENGSVNLAPFSYFNIVAHDIVSISFIPQKNGKDTLRNILRTKEAVINSVSIGDLNDVTLSSLNHDYLESEAEIHNIEMIKSTTLKTPRVKSALINFETTLINHIPVMDEEDNLKADMVLLQVIGANFDKSVIDLDKNYIDINVLNPGSRLAGVSYGNTSIEESAVRKEK